MRNYADRKAIADVIGLIYEAGYQPSLWPNAVNGIKSFMDGSAACITRLDFQTPSHSTFVAPDRDPQWNIDIQNYSPEGIIRPRLKAAAGTIYSDDRLYGRKGLHKTDVWNGWFAPQDMYGGIGCNLLVSDRALWFFDVQRGRRQAEFDSRDLAILAILAPHLQRAHAIGGQFAAAQSAPSFLSDIPFAAFVVDRHMKITSMNPAAHALLMRPTGAITARGEKLVFADTAREAMVSRAIAKACMIDQHLFDASIDILIRAKTGTALMVSVVPLPPSRVLQLRSAQPVALVTVRQSSDHETSLQLHRLLREQYGLTSKEAAIACQMANGVPLAAIADEQRITVPTARTHLNRIFRKTHTGRQGELILLLNKLPSAF